MSDLHAGPYDNDVTDAMKQRITETLRARADWLRQGDMKTGTGPVLTVPQAEAAGYYVWRARYTGVWQVERKGRYNPHFPFESKKAALAAVTDILIAGGWLQNEDAGVATHQRERTDHWETTP